MNVETFDVDILIFDENILQNLLQNSNIVIGRVDCVD